MYFETSQYSFHVSELPFIFVCSSQKMFLAQFFNTFLRVCRLEINSFLKKNQFFETFDHSSAMLPLLAPTSMSTPLCIIKNKTLKDKCLPSKHSWMCALPLGSVWLAGGRSPEEICLSLSSSWSSTTPQSGVELCAWLLSPCWDWSGLGSHRFALCSPICCEFMGQLPSCIQIICFLVAAHSFRLLHSSAVLQQWFLSLERGLK